MISFEDAIRMHVKNLQIQGKLMLRDDDVPSQLDRIEESINIMKMYGIACDFDDVLERVSLLRIVYEGINTATVEFTRFYDIAELMEERLNKELEDLFDDYPQVRYPVFLMRSYELALQ